MPQLSTDAVPTSSVADRPGVSDWGDVLPEARYVFNWNEQFAVDDATADLLADD